MSENNNNAGCGFSFGLGSLIAAVMSYSTHASIGWCILHTIFGWFYVIYWLIFWWGVNP